MKSSISMKSWKTTVSLSALLLVCALTVLSWHFMGVSMPSSLSSPASPANGSITYDKGANVITVTGYSSGTPCTFWDVWNASNVNGWNVVWNNHNNDIQYQFDCKIQVGDGSTTTWFNDTDKQIVFSAGIVTANYQGVFMVTSKAILTLGQLDNAATYSTSHGCTIRFNETTYHILGISDQSSTSIIKLYSTTISGASPTWSSARVYLGWNGGTWTIWNCMLLANTCWTSIVVNAYNVYVTRATAGVAVSLAGSTLNKLNLIGNDRGLVVTGAVPQFILSNAILANSASRDWELGGWNVDNYAINCESDWTMLWTLATTCRLYRQYTLDLRVTYPNDTGFQNANVTLYNRYSVVVFSLLTNSSGQIATQTISRGFYNQTGGNTLYDFAPFTLNITSTYAKYSCVFQLAQKTNWTIALQPLIDGGLIEHVGFVPVDPGLTSPSGTYRWLDVADETYGVDYQNSYNYSQAAVEVAYCTEGNKLQGLLQARNLKPNFAYQLKLVGTPGTADNERIGLAGRWWQEEWTGTKWANGQNLNDKGDGSSPNPNDQTYFSRRDIQDSSSPTGYHYRYTGYLVFDYFITDSNGTATLQFETGSCYHVIWKTTQRSNATNDGPVKTVTFDPDPSQPAYDTDYPSNTVSVFGEWERLPMGQVILQPGEYNCQIVLTEESFHGSGGTLAGNWAGAVTANIMFTIN